MLTVTQQGTEILLVYNGVRYLSDSEGHFRYNAENNHGTPAPHKTCNYLKYLPPSNDIVTSKNITLLNIEYYVNKYDYNRNTVELSLSQVPDEKIIGTISTNQFKQGIYMPAATVKYHPNSGEAAGNGYTIDINDNCSNIVDNFLTGNFQRVDKLFKKIGHQGTGVGKSNIDTWLYYHPYDKDASPLTITHPSSFNGKESYLPLYPDTTIYLYAEWALTPYTITYYENGDDKNKIVGTSIAHYNQLTTLIDSERNIPTGRKFMGWDTNPNLDARTSVPKYYALGDFILTTPGNINLYAIWLHSQSLKDNETHVMYKPGTDTYGYGYEGPLRYVVYKDEGLFDATFTLPGSQSVPQNFNDLYGSGSNKLPRHPGFSFQYWVQGESKYPPGESVSYKDYYTLSAEWDGPAAEVSYTGSTFNKDYDIPNRKYMGRQQTIQIDSKTYDRKITLQHNEKHSSAITRVIAYHIIDELGNSIPGSYCRYYYGKDLNPSRYKTQNILKANMTYYIEISSEDWDEITQTKCYCLNIKLEPATNTETISANTGSYYCGNNSTSSTSDVQITYQSNKDFVGASSSNYLLGLTTFNGTTGNYPSLPSKKGYWFEQWIGVNDAVPEYERTISNNTAFATKSPQRDFKISAIWNPNQFYIAYNGNDNDAETMMSNSAHRYDEQVTLLPNQYTRSTKIVYQSRKGYYQPKDWVENDKDNMTIIQGKHRSEREVKLHHTYLGWDYNNIHIEDHYSTTFENWTQLIEKSFENYGDSIELVAKWQFNSVKLPKMHRDGFIFMGWYTESDGGERVGYTIDDSGDEYFCFEGKEITLYAHWDPIGLIMLNVYNEEKRKNEWRYAIPYIFTNENGWQRALSNTYTDKEWRVGINLGQNLTDYQSDHL